MAYIAPITGVQEAAGGQAGYARAGVPARPDVPAVAHPVAEAVPRPTRTEAFSRVSEEPAEGKGRAPQALSNAQEEIEELTEKNRDIRGLRPAVEKYTRLAIFEDTGDVYAKVFKAATNELIKTIPPETRLEMRARAIEYIGKLIDRQA